MGRKPSQAPVKCGVCEKLSYLRDKHQSRNPQIKNDRYRKYSRWEHIDKKTKPKTHYKRIIDAVKYEELLKQMSISDERFLEVNSNTNDAIPLLKLYALTIEQLNQLPIIEQKEYLHLRDIEVAKKTDSEILDKIQRIEQKKLRELSGIKSIKAEQRESTIKPPKEDWGESDTRSLFLKWSREFNIVSKCLSEPPWKDPAAREDQMEVSKHFKTLSKQMKKLASLAYYFKPSSEADKKNIESYNEWYERSIELFYLIFKHLGLQIDNQPKPVDSNDEKIKQAEATIKLRYQFQLISDVLIGFTTVYKYIVDERYLLPFSGWLNVLVDRYKNYSIGGTSKKNLLRTGKYMGKLSTNQDEIDKAKKEGKPVPEFHYIVKEIPVAARLTKRQIKNMTQLIQIKNKTQVIGPVVRDLLNVLIGIRAQMELGITKKDKNIYDLINAISGGLSRAFSHS